MTGSRMVGRKPVTNPGPDPQRRPGSPPRTAFTRSTVHYALAVLGYLVIGILTKTLLTWTMATLYFVLALDVGPRIVGWLRKAASG